jgi:phenylacetate-CoA ligase
MGTMEVIKKFIESNWIIERTVLEIVERLPARLRYGISYGTTFRSWLAFLKESEHWDRDRLETYQVEQLRDLVIHAERNVPYYREIFGDYGFSTKKMQGLDDLKALPYTNRQTVKKRHNEFIAANIANERLIATRTSGTSGVPMTIFGTKESEEKHWATIVDLWGRIGYRPGSRTVFFQGDIREGKKHNLLWKKYGSKLILSSNYFVDGWIDRYREMINDFRPEYMIGFPHTLATFASYIKKRKKLFFERLKGTIVYAENLYPWQRVLIQEVFGSRVFADYGMTEKVIHGGECEHTYSYHLYPQYGLTEYLPLQDSMYELVGTGFINYAMPLINYKTGDVCRREKTLCPQCGRGYDILESIEGRVGDFLVTAEGQIVSLDLELDYSVFNTIERFQFYQEQPGVIELRVWPAESYRDGDSQALVREIMKNLGPAGGGMTFDVSLWDGKQSRITAKYRMVEQKLDMRNFLT